MDIFVRVYYSIDSTYVRDFIGEISVRFDKASSLTGIFTMKFFCLNSLDAGYYLAFMQIKNSV